MSAQWGLLLELFLILHFFSTVWKLRGIKNIFLKNKPFEKSFLV